MSLGPPTLDGMDASYVTGTADFGASAPPPAPTSVYCTFATTQPNDVVCALIFTEVKDGTWRGSPRIFTPGLPSITVTVTVQDIAASEASGDYSYPPLPVTFTLRATSNGSGTANLDLWWGVVPLASSQLQLNVNFASDVFSTASIIGFAVAGANTTNPFDPNTALPAMQSDSVTDSYHSVTADLACVTTNPNNLLICAIGSSGNANIGFTGSSPFTPITFPPYDLDYNTPTTDGYLAAATLPVTAIQNTSYTFTPISQFYGGFEAIMDSFTQGKPPAKLLLAEVAAYVTTPTPKQLTIILRYSDDRGASWSNPIYQTLGVAGTYDTDVSFRRLGMSRDRVWELSYAVTTPTSLTGAFVQFEINGT